ncbi:Crp/Fnr family transcriptional regulator [Lacticaseibacillus pabuli]|uniref:Crp/Fnr family transcriptional regulator n=1 Tax=Lacticaseibacillus pabuli TaxID=3025672 RepID=A0ABY7WRS8_9LACO|nr:Crp/Fnr family transcriptional regulator [Lacticaseibacillus sp. KACC 23028]WDF82816.1 Crp/Fnr family transcriptional regulator [Lacticaseibacillus sp. KACC 23028]
MKEMTHDPLQCVASAPIFAGVPESVLKQLVTISTHQQHFAAGELLYSAGEAAESLLVVDSGRVKIYSLNADGEEQIQYFLEPNAIDSEAALFTDKRHTNFAEVVEDAAICSIDKGAFQHLIASDGELALRMLNVYGHRLTDLETRTARLGTLTARDRLLQFLRSTGSAQGSSQFKLPMKKSELANWLNVTPETLSRQFKALLADNQIEMKGRLITLLA